MVVDSRQRQYTQLNFNPVNGRQSDDIQADRNGNIAVLQTNGKGGGDEGTSTTQNNGFDEISRSRRDDKQTNSE